MLLKTKDVCRLLNVSRSGLLSIQKKDLSFPKPFKLGNTRQSSVFYKKYEIEKWIENLNNDNRGE